MSKEVYRIEIPIETVDKYSDGLKKAEKDVKDFEKTAKGASKGFESIGDSARKSGGDVTKFQGVMRGAESKIKSLTGSRWNLTIHAVDRASRVVSGINSFVQRLAGRSYRFTVRAIDMASRTIRGIGRMITSIPAVVTIALSVIGLNKLKDVTVGAAMSFEQYEVSMTHWLDGNTKKAKELVGWMGQFADTTPFSSPDLFPALVEGVNITDGNIPEAKRMLKIASDMAALTPGSSVEEAMGAIGSAQSGNFEMMKRFKAGISKEELDLMGGFGKYIDHLEDRFKDGAKKLSETSKGILLTLGGYRNALFRSMGEGFLDPMKPRLDAINKWLGNNQDTWGKWKDTVKRHGKNASEFVFSNLEKGFNHVRTNYLDNQSFMDLSFKGKIAFVMGDINEWWNSKGKPALTSWWDSTGQPFIADMGLMIGKGLATGIKTGIKEGLSTIGKLWENVGEDAKEHGVFSKETATSAGGAALATGGALAVGSMMLAPLFKGAGGLFKGGKTVAGGIGGLFSKKSKMPTVIPDTKKSSGKQTTETKKPKSKTYSERTQELHKSRTTPPKPPKTSPFSKFKLPKMPKVPKIPKGLTSGLKRVPILGTLLGAATIAGSTKDNLAGNVGAVGGGLAGAKGGAMAGAAIGSIVPGAGTAIGAGIGGIVGGIGGALGGEKLMSWLFGPKKASASEVVPADSPSGQAPSSDLALNNEGSQLIASATAELAGKIQLAQGNIEILTMHLGEASGHVVGAFQPLSEGTGLLQQNIETLTMYLGEASGHVAGAFYPITEQGPLLAQNMNALGINLAESSVHVVTAFYPLTEQGPLLGQNMNALGINLAESSISVVGAFHPLSEQGPLLHQNMSALSINLAESSVHVVGAFNPVSENGALLNGNLQILTGWVGQASGWVATLHGIQDGAASVKSALTNLASRISSVPTPSVSVGSSSGGAKHAAYANGGFINKPHLGLVGEAGPEMIIPLSPGRKGRAMDLYQRAGQMLGVKPYANGGLAGQSPSSGRNNNVIDFFGRTGVQPQTYNDEIDVEPMVSTSPNSGGSGTAGGVSFGDINVNPVVSVVVQASSDGSIDISGISDEVVDQIGVKLANKIMEAKGNMFITAG